MSCGDIDIDIMPSDDVRYLLRIPRALYESLKRISEETGVSMNRVICNRVSDRALAEVKNGFGEAKRVKREKDVSGVRGSIQDTKGRRARDNRITTVLRPSDGTSTDSGAVDKRVQQNTVIQEQVSVVDRKYRVPHAKDCGCLACIQKRTEVAVEGDF